jgi:serine/threonine-protein kinase HipA
MIKVWTDAAEAGLLDRHGERGSTFAYLPGAPPTREVSVTMPLRLESWSVPFGLLPVFEMNLPEGVLRERLRLAFAKATGTFDEFDLLSIVGRSQVGRIRYTGDKEHLHEEVPFQSVDEILEGRRGGDLFRYLLEKFASFSGISGVQPKILVRDEKAFAEMGHTGTPPLAKLQRRDPHREDVGGQRISATGGQRVFLPHRSAQIRTRRAPYRLAEDGMALVIDRFDLRMDGTYRGFEDFCVLNGRRTDEKYRGSYESSIMKRFGQFANSTHVGEDMEKLFVLIVLNCALRNGDAHLKNFGIVYDDVQGEARLAPVYDFVTTSAYLPKDSMALTLNGTTKWASTKELQRLGETRMGGTPSRVRQILERTEAAIADTSKELQAYIKAHAEFREIGNRMLEQWEEGVALSLKAARANRLPFGD